MLLTCFRGQGVATGAGPVSPDREREPHHEEGAAGKREDLEVREGDGAGVRVRVHQLHHRRGLRQVPAREAQDDQRRRPALGDDHSGLRGLRGASQRLPLALPRNGRREDRGSLPRNSHTFPYQGSKCGVTFPELCRIGCHC
ncbi:hypothetical protein glysoja_033746 [Glycine soja]|uniref:Uncharacterized protein n=1 Tax=Glycine soja TaxID=3848 RepID=A0A0B2QEY7_GLYSO|nr:hypothetical protein glysoja_033746 [Glycine soja]